MASFGSRQISPMLLLYCSHLQLRAIFMLQMKMEKQTNKVNREKNIELVSVKCHAWWERSNVNFAICISEVGFLLAADCPWISVWQWQDLNGRMIYKPRWAALWGLYLEDKARENNLTRSDWESCHFPDDPVDDQSEGEVKTARFDSVMRGMLDKLRNNRVSAEYRTLRIFLIRAQDSSRSQRGWDDGLKEKYFLTALPAWPSHCFVSKNSLNLRLTHHTELGLSREKIVPSNKKEFQNNKTW